MICVSLSDKKTLFADIYKYSFVEIRLDILSLNTHELKECFANCNKSIATCRASDSLSREQRENLICSSIEAGATYVDIDFAEPNPDVIALAKNLNCRIILSYHNFDKTPSNIFLKKLIFKYQFADIVKIATFINTPKDASRLLSLYQLDYKVGLVALGMGELGRFTRIASHFLGAPLSFAFPDGGKPTALGQYSFSSLKSILNSI